MQASTTDQATIDRITAKAMEEFFRFGIRSVSMDDISKLMGMSKKTLYKYFDNKKDLVHSVVRYKILQEVDVLDSVETQARDAIHEMVILSEHIIDHVSTIAPTVVIDLQKYYPQSWSHIQSFQREHLYKMIKSNVDRGILEGYYRNTLRSDIISKLYVSMCFIIDDVNTFPQHIYNREIIIRQVIYYHLNGILTEEGRAHLHQFELFKTYYE